MGEHSDTIIRVGIFISVLVIMASLELFLPKRQLVASKSKRWFTNISMTVISNILVRLMGAVALPIVALGAALYSEQSSFGLFYLLELPFWLTCLLSIVILDFAIYFQHVLSHHIPVLWRLHRVHHADRDIDVTTATRFHPIEIMLSMLYKAGLIILLGAPVLAVFIFEIILSSLAMFNHANVALSPRLDRLLRLLIVTPDMHRVHHSVHVSETNSNYGFNLAIWDYLCGTYTSQPRDGHEKMTIGLNEYQTSKPTGLMWSLSLPFLSRKADSKNAEENI